MVAQHFSAGLAFKKGRVPPGTIEYRSLRSKNYVGEFAAITLIKVCRPRRSSRRLLFYRPWRDGCV